MPQAQLQAVAKQLKDSVASLTTSSEAAGAKVRALQAQLSDARRAAAAEASENSAALDAARSAAEQLQAQLASCQARAQAAEAERQKASLEAGDLAARLRAAEERCAKAEAQVRSALQAGVSARFLRMSHPLADVPAYPYLNSVNKCLTLFFVLLRRVRCRLRAFRRRPCG